MERTEIVTDIRIDGILNSVSVYIEGKNRRNQKLMEQCRSNRIFCKNDLQMTKYFRQ